MTCRDLVLLCVVRLGREGKLVVRTDGEENEVKTGESPGTHSVLDLTFNTKLYVGGVTDHALDAVRTRSVTSCFADTKVPNFSLRPKVWSETELICKTCMK